jgi:hypothetical protein
MRVRERFGRRLTMSVGQLWARSGLVSGLRRSGPGGGVQGIVSSGGPLGRVFPQVTDGSPALAWRTGSSGVLLRPAVTQTHDGRKPPAPRVFSRASRVPAGAAAAPA